MAQILLVDDEPALRNNLSRYLTRLGHDVHTAGNGKEALTAMDEWSVDLLITDLNMPEMDGMEMLNTLRGRASRVPVIAMSGGGEFDKSLLLGSASLLGALMTLEKPFNLDELRRAVERLLDG